MEPQKVFDLYRAYRLFYQSKYDFIKYHGKLPSQPLFRQRDRQFYYRIAQKMTDAQIHACFQAGFLYHPNAYIADLATPTAMKAALMFAGRQENGRPLLEADLHTLRIENHQQWLYGLDDTGKLLSAVPDCLHYLHTGQLPADVACLLLLIPQPQFQYNWPEYWAAQPDSGLGPHQIIDRLKKLDQLFYLFRPGWRQLAYDLAYQFWYGFMVSGLHTSLAPATRPFHF